MKRRSAGTRPGKAGKKKGISKGLTRRGLRKLLIYGCSAAAVIVLVLAVLYFSRPKFIWYVDEEFASAWGRILAENGSPYSRYEVVAHVDGGSFPKDRFGAVISRRGPSGERVEGAPVVLFPNLSRTRVSGSWQALAVDPWMVFRKHQDPEPGRSFLNNTNERGSVVLAGLEKQAVNAWLSQLLQEEPGVFSPEGGLWEAKGLSLARDYPFQSGAATYSWIQAWPLLFRGAEVSIYAPLSQARAQPPYRMGLLDATRFPEPEHWDRYGMQADILWGRLYGTESQLKKIDAAGRWLREPKTQTAIANEIEWIPAHPSGTPYNTISWEAQMAWLRSSYIWQGALDAQDS